MSDQLLIRNVAQMNMFRHTHTRERGSFSKKEKQCELVFSYFPKIEFLSSWSIKMKQSNNYPLLIPSDIYVEFLEEAVHSKIKWRIWRNFIENVHENTIRIAMNFFP